MRSNAVSAEVWTKRALCAGHPGRGWWFPADYRDAEANKAIAVCRACPVAGECLDYSIATGQSEGVWGGTIPSERLRMARAADGRR